MRSELSVPIERGALAMARVAPAGGGARAAVVLLHGFAQNRYAWDLPSRSFAAYLARCGFDVFVPELRGHGRSRRAGAPLAERFEDYVERDVPAALDAVAALGHARAFLVGHSLGGAVAYAAAPAEARRLAGVVTLSGVYRWGGATRLLAGLVRVLGGLERVQRRLGVGAGSAVRLDLAGRVLAARLGRNPRAPLPLPLHGWVPNSIEPAVLGEWLRRSLDRDSAAVLGLMGRWGAARRFSDTADRVDYGARWTRAELPVLVCGADRDRLAHPLRDVRPAFDASRARDRTWRCFGRAEDGAPFGHVDLVIGDRAPAVVWPYVADWLVARS
jgi:alpha-beta hydrolase superfamily lysophospholipase